MIDRYFPSSGDRVATDVRPSALSNRDDVPDGGYDRISAGGCRRRQSSGPQRPRCAAAPSFMNSNQNRWSFPAPPEPSCTEPVRGVAAGGRASRSAAPAESTRLPVGIRIEQLLPRLHPSARPAPQWGPLLPDPRHQARPRPPPGTVPADAAQASAPAQARNCLLRRRHQLLRASALGRRLPDARGNRNRR